MVFSHTFFSLAIVFLSLLFERTASASFLQDIDNTNAEMQQRPVIQFLHEYYPPYVYAKNGSLEGNIARLTSALLSEAGYDAVWQQTNYSRLIRELQYSGKPICAAGYSALHQSMYKVLATKPIAWFPGAALVIRRADLPMFSSHQSIGDVLQDDRLRGAFLRDVSYEGVTHDLLVRGKDRHLFVGGSDTELGLLVARGRVHFAPINPDQTAYLQSEIQDAAAVTVFKPSGMRAPRTVSIMCSHEIGSAFIDKLNAVIPQLAPYHPQ